MATYRYSGQAVVANDDILENAVGGTFVDQTGAAIPIFDLNDNPITTITSNAFGQSSSFKANVPMGYIKFGSVLNRVFADEIAQFAVNAQAAVDTANSALASASAALSAVQDLIASGGGTSLPPGTDLDDIPNSTTRLAMTQVERDKLSTVAANATALTLGTTATTAKPGNYSPTPAGIGALAVVGGSFREWKPRPASQGYPTVGEGAQEGDVASLYQEA